MLVLGLFSSGRYCLIQVSNDAMSTGCTLPPGPHLHLLDGVRQLVEVFGVGLQAGAAHQQRAVVVGEPFSHPQALRVVLGLVVERAEFHRPQALDVPVVEVLVADEVQPVHVGAAGARGEAARHGEERVLVLEAAAGLGHHVQEEVVGIVERPHRGPAGLDDLLHVGGGAVGVEERRIALEHQVVRLAVDVEGLRVTELPRTIGLSTSVSKSSAR